MKLQREDIHPLQDTCPYFKYVAAIRDRGGGLMAPALKISGVLFIPEDKKAAM